MRLCIVVFLCVVVMAGCGKKSAAPETLPRAAQDRELWQELAPGMAEDKVRAILGEPIRVEKQGDVTCWYYRKGPSPVRNPENTRWIIARAALLFSTQEADSPRLLEWRDP